MTDGPTIRHDVLMGMTRGTPVEITVSAVQVRETDEEAEGGALAYLGEVLIDGHPVFGERCLVHRSMVYSEHATREVKARAIAGFAARLREVLGYDHREHR